MGLSLTQSGTPKTSILAMRPMYIISIYFQISFQFHLFFFFFRKMQYLTCIWLVIISTASLNIRVLHCALMFLPYGPSESDSSVGIGGGIVPLQSPYQIYDQLAGSVMVSKCLVCLVVHVLFLLLNEEIMTVIFVCLVCCFTSQSTAMVVVGWSVHLTTLFSWTSLNKPLTNTSCTYFRL